MAMPCSILLRAPPITATVASFPLTMSGRDRILHLPVVFRDEKGEIEADMSIFPSQPSANIVGRSSQLDVRGWIFQELLLAKRVFFFHKGAFPSTA